MRQMELGATVFYRDRPFVLVGVDPMSVPDRRAYLRDPVTGEVLEVPFTEVDEAPEASGLPQDG
jgi:hypothetical protein